MAADDIPQVRRRLRRLHEDADMVHRRIVMLTVAGDHTPTVMLLSIIPGVLAAVAITIAARRFAAP